ncbi:type 1 glutamine amidotransferase [Planosporangium flavigriseum]|uniref:Glutamine amidotransferase n=1 Tax=Planosporangium flavigriseum TaxID=373681 RepID=A0A8J3PM52_9ACTN|nr:type 1 glutamine amidotransferase domain-containing protein [Planosporangium flavigriseum]NJC65984.1 type 1 glutamine amidotransferase [Planosporangium flavigriseum]GIG74552.1 glutamine amidotransferase [Planosporangium flavigriseum]
MSINGKSVAFLVAKEGIEQVELTEPWKAVEQSGGDARLISVEPGTVQAFNHLTPADTFSVDETADAARAEDYSALVLPGGVANGDLLRWQEPARDFVRRFVATGRPVAVICHGGWVLIDVDAVRDRRVTSWPSLAVDYRNAGAEWVDEQLVVCTGGNFPLISSRKPDDLPAFCRELVSQVKKVSVATATGAR